MRPPLHLSPLLVTLRLHVPHLLLERLLAGPLLPALFAHFLQLPHHSLRVLPQVFVLLSEPLLSAAAGRLQVLLAQMHGRGGQLLGFQLLFQEGALILEGVSVSHNEGEVFTRLLLGVEQLSLKGLELREVFVLAERQVGGELRLEICVVLFDFRSECLKLLLVS